VSLGYPPEVVALAEDAARTVLAAVAEGREPFATVGDAWLRRGTLRLVGWVGAHVSDPAA